MSMLRNLATSLINARDERIKTTVQKAKELRPFVERVITLAKRANLLEGDEAAAQSLCVIARQSPENPSRHSQQSIMFPLSA